MVGDKAPSHRPHISELGMDNIAFILLVQPFYETEVRMCFRTIRPDALFEKLETRVKCDNGWSDDSCERGSD
jgi:hypothetical protein